MQCTEAKCPILKSLADARADLARIFKVIHENSEVVEFFGGTSSFTYANLLRNFVVVGSRSFHINITKTHGQSLLGTPGLAARIGTNIFFMAPYADLFNHHNSFPALQSSYHVDDKTNTLVFTADQDYRAGEQVE